MSGEFKTELNPEALSRSVKLSRELAGAGVIGKKEGEPSVLADSKAQEILKSGFFPSQYESVAQMLALSRDENVSSDVKRNAETSLRDLSTALFLASPKMEEWLISGQIDQNVPTSFEGISAVVGENWLMDGANDTVGREIVKKLSGVEALNRKAIMAPSAYEERRKDGITQSIDSLMSTYDELTDPDSTDGIKLGMVIGYLDGTLPAVATSETTKVVEAVGKMTDTIKETVDELFQRLQESRRNESEDVKERRQQSALDRIKAAIEATAKTKEGTPEELTEIFKTLVQDELSLVGDEKALNEKRNDAINSAARWFSDEPATMTRTEFSKYKEKDSYTVDEAVALLERIEASGRESTDLTYNADHARHLDKITNGDVKLLDANGNLLGKEEREWLIREIKMSLAANDWFLAASTSTTVEDMFKTSMRIHQGDTDHTLDHDFLSHYLDRRKRLGIKMSSRFNTADAWDLRQRVNFEYIKSVGKMIGVDGKEVKVATSGYLYDSWLKHRDFIIESFKDGAKARIAELSRVSGRNIIESDENIAKMVKTMFLESGSPMLKKSDKFGIEQDYYTNYRMDVASARGQVVKELMARDLAKSTNERDLKDARRSVELARRLAVITYIDSLANIGFIDGDDYAEILLFKFIRYTDQVEGTAGSDPTKKKEGPKNKPTGWAETIKYIDYLSPSWLQTLLKESAVKEKKGQVYSMTFADDIDFDNMGSKSAMHYHLGSIVMKKVLPTQQGFLKRVTPKDTVEFADFVQRRYDQMNKTMTEGSAKGWQLLNLKANGMVEDTPLAVKERKFRFWFVANMLGLGVQSLGGGWTREELSRLKRYVTENRLYGDDNEQSLSFISEDQWKWMMGDRVVIGKGKDKRVDFGLGLRRALNYEEDADVELHTPFIGGGKH